MNTAVLLLAGSWFVTSSIAAFAQAPILTEAWVQHFRGIVQSNSTDSAAKVVIDAAGDVIVTGTTDDRTGRVILTIKYSGTDGRELWRARSLTEYGDSADLYQIVTDMSLDRSGNVIVTGCAHGDYYTAKYAALNGALLWEKSYDGGSYDWAVALAIDQNGDVIVTGRSEQQGTASSVQFYDYCTVKYSSSDGAVQWARRYNGPANRNDEPKAVSVDEQGNVLVTGDSLEDHSYAFYTAKYAAADGAVIWEQRYFAPARGEARTKGLIVDAGGNAIVMGYSGNGITAYIAKYSSADGALLWEHLAGGVNFNGMAVDREGNVLAAGTSDNENLESFYAAKYSGENGLLLWESQEKTLTNRSDIVTAITVDFSGNALVTGYRAEENPLHFYTSKYRAADGMRLWTQRSEEGRLSYAVDADANGNVVVTGSSPTWDNPDYHTIKYSTDGQRLWEARYGGPAYEVDAAAALVIDTEGNVIVTGNSGRAQGERGPQGYSDYHTVKYAVGTGEIVWERRYSGPSYYDFARAVAVDRNGHVIVTGASKNSGYGDDFYTAKYAAVDGAILWERRLVDSRPDPGGPSIQGAQAIALDANDDVIVTGSSHADFCTVKYASSNGALLWQQRYDGPAGRADSARSLALDRSGNVFVTGYSEGNRGTTDFYTAKYAAADGALLWERRYDGPAKESDSAYAIAVDNHGDAVVTGHSQIGQITTYYTAKYSGADGAVLWEKRTKLVGAAQALALDGSGNVIVTGSLTISLGPTRFRYDDYTAKYAAANGDLVWERRYGSTNSSDRAYAVAVDARGNAIITGQSDDPSDYDYFTAKYAAADGTLLWEKRQGPRANSPPVLALGRNGGMAIAGSSRGDGLVILYRENLPALTAVRNSHSLRLRFAGMVGESYRIEHAPGPSGPWTTFATPTSSQPGIFEYETIGLASEAGFYRVASP